MKKMLSEFKEFIVKGNVLDLAVGVVIGSAFTAIVKQVVDGLITPLVGLIVSLIPGTKNGSLEDSLTVLDVRINGVVFQFGDVISAIVTFIITGFVLFLVVRAANRAKELRKPAEEELVEDAPTAEEYLAEIRDLLKAQQNGQLYDPNHPYDKD
ncbi:large conductance mechanosensitive channel protein [Enterococcus sp. AZ150]|uniref:Large-conductance mechanosensitive channel n=2 Tax=Enterococcus TaxID=1350 RepID=S0L547_9ENTE|nr:large conductance mechanosensitive channel protein [Enterococcus sulfureus ATCC 49903]EOT86067.1 large conductance mechanosensitive channel protein [Enterococcus sulfureus ATCC 49903]